MKKLVLLFALLLGVNVVAFGQAKKPTIMVVPADAWCNRNGFVMQVDNMGSMVSVPDYAKAFANNSEIRTMVSAMADFMAKNEFPIQSLEQELKRLQNESAEMAMMEGKMGGMVVETPIERLRRTAKADIILNLDYTIRRAGPRQQVEFNLQAIDAYSSKIISGNTGTSSPISTSDPVTSVLEESVLSFKDNFLTALQTHFDDMFANGREISVTLFRYDNCPIDFEEEVSINGYTVELADVIEAWFGDKAKEGRFSLDSKSANRMRFNQVRIPLYAINPLNGKERAIDANGFVGDLVQMLKKPPYSLTVGRTPKGLGEVWITIGDK